MKINQIQNFKYLTSFNYLIIFLLLVIATYLSFIGGYGSDEDTVPMIEVFLNKLFGGVFITSRFTGNPVAEIGIGFLSYFYGSFYANLVTFSLFIFGLIAFFFSFKEKNNFSLFILLCLSNPILYFDNIEPVDYSWAFFFYAVGLFLFKNKLFEFCIIFFGLAIGTRINFFLFIFFSILFFYDEEISLKKRLYIILSTLFVGCLFYLPIWYHSKFQFHWLTAGRPIEQGTIGLIYRFLYKSFYAFGGLSLILLIFLYLKNYLKILKNKNFLFFITVVISNLLLFLWIPAELSYLQLAIIVFLFFFVMNVSKKYVYLVIFLNFLSWAVNPQFLKIKYRYDGRCDAKQAISANFTFKFEEGYYFKYLDTRDLINCRSIGNPLKYEKYKLGKPLK